MSTEYQVQVKLSDRSYPIHILRNGLKYWKDALRGYVENRKVIIISDSNVYALYADKVVELLTDAGAYLYASVFPAGEAAKSQDRLGKIYHKLASAALGRDSVVVALGGGVTGDIAGFVAATYMRGIDYIQIPTSLLAMVDSSVGGKTGVDLPEGKNLVGAFWQPKAVFIDPAFLKTLPKREYACGLAEVVKYGVITDAAFFADMERNVAKIQACDPDYYTWLITRSCQLKAQTVSADERENNVRAMLNYGHTFGHALEKITHYERFSHGEAVAIGMGMAMDLACKLGRLAPECAARQDALLRACHLPVAIDGIDPEALFNAMSNDKKNRRGVLTFVLPNKIGGIDLCSELDRGLIMEAICGRIN